MTQPILKTRRYTLAEYFELENKAEFRSEFHDGEILMMSGGSYSHARIVRNLVILLGNELRGKPCEPFDSSLRVYSQSYNKSFYPDATIACPPMEFLNDDPVQGTLLNPKVLFEVLSPSTAPYDLGRKVDYYCSIPSLQQYVLLEQDRPEVILLSRRPDGWLRTRSEGLESSIALESVQLRLPFKDLYRDIEFTPEADDASI
jgi:Uma2 family endonuclease